MQSLSEGRGRNCWGGTDGLHGRCWQRSVGEGVADSSCGLIHSLEGERAAAYTVREGGRLVQTGEERVADSSCSLIHDRFSSSNCMKSGEKSQREHSRALHISLEYPRGLRIIGEQSGGGRQGGHVGGGPRGHSGAHLILYIRPFPHSLAIFFSHPHLRADPGPWTSVLRLLDFGLWALTSTIIAWGLWCWMWM
jgi:hypothetical protein